MGGLRSAFPACAAAGPAARPAERAAAYLGQRLTSEYIVVARYAPRDGSDVVPLVVLGPHGVLVVEPRDDEGALVCYQDHWYRRTAPGVCHPVAGGFVVTRRQPDDVGSSCCPVIAGMDALVRHLEDHPLRDASIEH